MKQLILLFNLLTLCLLFGCKKDPISSTPITTKPKPQIAVALNQAYLNGAKVDSALVTWEINGQAKTVKMQLRNDSLIAELSQFQQGTGKISFEVFSGLKLRNQYKMQWVQQNTMELSHTNDIKITGPSSFTDAQWIPRVRLEDAVGNVAIVALRPNDPYFKVQNLPGNVLELVVARNFWINKGGPPSIVGGGEWKCRTNCKNENGDVINSSHFSFLPQQIGARQWNHIEIVVLYIQDRNGGGYVLSLDHDVE